MALRIGEKVVVDLPKGIQSDVSARKGEALVFPEGIPPVGPTTKTITITSDDDATLHGTIELEEKYGYYNDGTSFSYWAVTNTSLVGRGQVNFSFTEQTYITLKASGEDTALQLFDGISTSKLLHAEDFEFIASFRPNFITKTARTDFSADAYKATGSTLAYSGLDNGLEISSTEKSIDFGAGFVQLGGKRYYHNAFTYTPSSSFRGMNSVPIYAYDDHTAYNSSSIYPVITKSNLRSNLIRGYYTSDSYRVVAVVDISSTGKITRLEDRRLPQDSATDYMLSYNPDFSTTGSYIETSVYKSVTDPNTGREYLWYLHIPDPEILVATTTNSAVININDEDKIEPFKLVVNSGNISELLANTLQSYVNNLIRGYSSSVGKYNIFRLTSTFTNEELTYTEIEWTTSQSTLTSTYTTLYWNGNITSTGDKKIKTGIPLCSVFCSGLTFPTNFENWVYGTEVGTINVELYGVGEELTPKVQFSLPITLGRRV